MRGKPAAALLLLTPVLLSGCMQWNEPSCPVWETVPLTVAVEGSTQPLQKASVSVGDAAWRILSCQGQPPTTTLDTPTDSGVSGTVVVQTYRQLHLAFPHDNVTIQHHGVYVNEEGAFSVNLSVPISLSWNGRDIPLGAITRDGPDYEIQFKGEAVTISISIQGTLEALTVSRHYDITLQGTENWTLHMYGDIDDRSVAARRAQGTDDFAALRFELGPRDQNRGLVHAVGGNGTSWDPFHAVQLEPGKYTLVVVHHEPIDPPGFRLRTDVWVTQ